MKKIVYAVFLIILTVSLTACSSSSVKNGTTKGVKNATSNKKNSNTKKILENLISDIELERETAEIYVFKNVDLSTEDIEGNFDVILLAGNMNIINRTTGESGRGFHRSTAVIKKNGEVISIKDKEQKIAKKISNSYDVAYHERNGKVNINKL